MIVNAFETLAKIWWVDVLADAVVLAAVILVILWLVLRSRFRARLRATVGGGSAKLAEFHRRYPEGVLLRRSRMIVRMARLGEEWAAIPREIGMTRLWVGRLAKHRRRGDYRRVLAFGSGEDLWPCFLLALAHPRQGERFLKWFEGRDAFSSLRAMARAGGGGAFDGRRAIGLFAGSVDRIREMAGDPDWRVRHFAVTIILHDGSELSRRALWEALHDGAFQIRRLVVPSFVTIEADRLFEELYDLVLHDAVFAVRKAARERIQRELRERYHPDLTTLASHEALHVLELLLPGSETDRDIALSMLGQAELELRAAAARYLLREGVLRRILATADLGDREAFARNLRLLRNAAEVDVTAFLDEERGNGSPATVLMALKLLSSHGPRSLIRAFAERALRGSNGSEHAEELRSEALACIEARGNDDALRLLFREILVRRGESAAVSELLEHVPPRGEELFVEVALELLRDPFFTARQGLARLLVRLPEHLVVAPLLDIVQDSGERAARPGRAEALRALAMMRRPHLLDFVLEHCYLLSPEAGRELAASLAEAHGGQFDLAAARLIEGHDVAVRAAVISALPATGRRDLLRLVRPAVDDPDPGVRSAAISSLVLFGDTPSLSRAVNRLRDPVEEVRVAAAHALGCSGSEELLFELRRTLGDPNEVDSVRLAAIDGLGRSGDAVATDLLVEALAAHEELLEPITDALARKSDPPLLSHLVDRCREADPQLRQKLTTAFRRMGAAGQNSLLALLHEEIGSLRPHVAQILEELGVVDSMIRRLSHRDPAIRRAAAEQLSLVGTNAAFRGIVQAARDPDQDVRVQVVRALERLETEAGADILRSLRADPERRVRKYTEWALERLKTKAL